MRDMLAPVSNRAPYKLTEEFISNLINDIHDIISKNEFFWLGDLAVKHGMHRNRFSEIAARNEEFAHAYEALKQHQENMIVKGAFGKRIDSTMAIFALKNISGWRDRQELEHSGPDRQPLQGNAPVSIQVITVEPTKASISVKEEEPQTEVVECQPTSE